ncbi:unnamed protein product, partial [Prorocentrum cordatum]
VQTMPNATIPWFDGNGRRNFVRHKLNDRESQATLEKQVENIFKFGVCEEARGVPMATLSAGDSPPYNLFTFGHLSTAFYLALERNPNNTNVKAAFRKGLSRVIVFQFSTPDDVVSWVKTFMNYTFGQQQVIQIVEILECVFKMQAEWRAHCFANGITSRGPATDDESYRQKAWAFVSEHFKTEIRLGMVTSSTQFESYCYIVNCFSKDKFDNWTQVRKWFMDNAVFDDGQLTMSKVLSALRSIASFVTSLSNAKSGLLQAGLVSLSLSDCRMVLEEMCKFTVVTIYNKRRKADLEDCCSTSNPKKAKLDKKDTSVWTTGLDKYATNTDWLLRDGAEANAKLKILTVDIKTGKVYKEAIRRQQKIDVINDAICAAQSMTKPAGAASGRNAGKKTKAGAGGIERLFAEAKEEPTEQSEQQPDEEAALTDGDKKDEQAVVPAASRRRGGGKKASTTTAVEMKHMETVKALKTAKDMPITWFEDMWVGMSAAIDDGLGSAAFHGDEQRKDPSTVQAVDKVTFNELKKTLSGWSAVRAEAKKTAAQIVLSSRCASKSTVDAGCAAMSDESKLNSAEKQLNSVFSDDTFTEHISDFLSNNPCEVDMFVNHLPCFAALMTAAWKSFESYAKASMPTKKDKDKPHLLDVGSVMTWVMEGFSQCSQDCAALGDKFLIPAKDLAVVWANPEQYGDFVVPEAATAIFPDMISIENYLLCRGKCVIELMTALLIRCQSRGIVWTVNSAAIPKEKVSTAVQILKQESQSKSVLFHMDCRCIGLGRDKWQNTWNSTCSLLFEAVLHKSVTAESEQLDTIINDICVAAQTLWGVQQASQAAQEAFDKEVENAGAVEAVAASDAIVAAGTASEPKQSCPASGGGPGLTTLGTLGEVIRYQDSSLYADAGDGPTGSALRSTQVAKNAGNIEKFGIFKVPAREVTAAFVKQVCLAVEGQLFNLAFAPNCKSESSCRIDVTFASSVSKKGSNSGISSIKMVSEKKIVKESTTDLPEDTWAPKMFFAGTVTTTPTMKQSFHIMTICGVDVSNSKELTADNVMAACESGSDTMIQIPLYVGYDETQHGIVSDCPIPAWMVTAIDATTATTTAAPKRKSKAKPPPPVKSPELPQAPLTVAFQNVVFDLPSWLHVGNIKECRACLPCLVASGASSNPPVELWRYLLPDEKVKPTARGQANQTATDAAGASALLGGNALANSKKASHAAADGQGEQDAGQDAGEVGEENLRCTEIATLWYRSISAMKGDLKANDAEALSKHERCKNGVERRAFLVSDVIDLESASTSEFNQYDAHAKIAVNLQERAHESTLPAAACVKQCRVHKTKEISSTGTVDKDVFEQSSKMK